MVNKAYIKSTGRLFKKHIVRLLSIALIFIVTVSLDSGFGDVSENLKKTITLSYQEDNLHDFAISTLRNTSSIIQFPSFYDLLKDELTNKKDEYEVSTFEEYYSYDMPDLENELFAYRAEFRDFSNTYFNKLTILEGRLPKYSSLNNEIEVVVERPTKEIKSHKIGDVIDIDVYSNLLKQFITPCPHQQIKAKIVGIVKNPRIVCQTKESSEIPLNEPTEDGDYTRHVNDVFYFDKNVLDPSALLDLCPTLLVGIKDRKIFNSFNKEYTDKIQIIEGKIVNYIKEITFPFTSDLVVVASLNNPIFNYGLYSLDLYASKVDTIATIFIVFFILIAVLVIYSTMSRLLDEERGSMAVLKTLGYSNLSIGFRYILFMLVAGIIGILVSIVPARLVCQAMLNAFTIQYVTKTISVPLIGSYFFILVAVILLTSLILVLIRSVKMASSNPVDLLTHKAPKIGKQILIERWKTLWSKLSFKFKSTCRNIFLFKSRLIMTLLSVVASTILVFSSFCLLDCTIANINRGISSLFMISLILVIFSGALCALVVYNITNINISERRREIATLMVCGYRNKEVTGYIFREIYILAIAGALIGLPAGVGFISFVFKFLDISFLSFNYVHWYVYIISPIVTIIFAFIATLLLRYKIIKTDMNESLKVLE